MKGKILFALAGLAAIAMVSCTDDTSESELCGNSVLDAGEACDGALGITTCSALDASKTWQAGGVPTCGAKGSASACKILVGSCVEEGVVVACGDGKKQGIEACDGSDGVPATCADFDSTKTWKTGGAPACGAKDSADACKILIGSCVEEGVVVACGDGKKQGIEACDGADGLPLTCAAFDSTKTWQAGGAPACGAKDTADACKILIGTCLEVEAPVCGDGKKEGIEACDGTDGVPATCADYDSTKTWQKTGAPACGASQSADACKILVGSCVEEGVAIICGDGQKQGSEICDYGATQKLACSEIDSKYVSGFAQCESQCSAINLTACVAKMYCGDGIVNNGELCEPSVAVASSCADFDKTKIWQADGKPGCNAAKAANECKLNIGSCVEAVHTIACDDGIVEGDEVCDFDGAKSKACKLVNPKYISGSATCENACTVLNVSGCVEDAVMGLKWCQLMPPTQVIFTNLVSEVTINALVHVSGVTDKTRGLDKTNAPKARFTYGEDPNKLDEWFYMAATGDPATDHPFADNYTAKLTKKDMIDLGPDVKQAYYSIGFAMHDSNDFKYCRRNMVDGAVEDLSLKFINDKVDANVHIMGSAKVQDIAVDKMICEFTFDGLTGITKDSVIPASTGTCTIQAIPNTWCVKTVCITVDSYKSWNLDNWKKALADALAGSHVILKASTTGANNIDLALKIRRTNVPNSPDKVAVQYSTDGTTYTQVKDILLTTDPEMEGSLLDYRVALPSGVNNQALLYIKLAPYGSMNNALRFDDIQLSKR